MDPELRWSPAVGVFSLKDGGPQRMVGVDAVESAERSHRLAAGQAAQMTFSLGFFSLTGGGKNSSLCYVSGTENKFCAFVS